MNSQSDSSATVGYFDGQALGWTRRYGRDGYFRERLETIRDWLKDAPPGSRLLDYGCGSGVMVAELAHAGHHVTGVDASKEMLISARTTLEAAGVAVGRFRLEQVVDDFQGEYLNHTYDGIISLGVIEYLDRPLELLERLINCLGPRGLMILSFPNRSSLLRKLERFIFKYPAPFRHLGLFSHLTEPDGYLNFQKHQFTIRELEGFFAQRGLLRERVRYCVVPQPLRTWKNHPALGMTVFAQFCRIEHTREPAVASPGAV